MNLQGKMYSRQCHGVYTVVYMSSNDKDFIQPENIRSKICRVFTQTALKNRY